MKRLLALALVALMAGSAYSATAAPATLAVFWDAEFTETNIDIAAGGSHPLYMVVMDADMPDGVPAIRAVEFGIDNPGGVFQFGTYPGGGAFDGSIGNGFIFWTLAGPAYPVLEDGAALVATFTFFLFGSPAEILMGPGTPNSIPDIPGPVLVNHDNTILVPATLPIAAEDWDPDTGWGVVATINGGGVVATEDATLSSVKSLFR